MRAVPSTLHQMMKFPIEEGVKTVYGEQHAAKEMFAIKEVVLTPEPSTSKKWSTRGDGFGIVLKPPTGDTIRQSIKTPRLTNNEAEYEAMIVNLELAKSLGAEVIEAKSDSLLVVNQVNKSFKVREDRMQRYLDKLEVTLHRFKE
ncbi:uncharacterized protein [Nicotiana sylvestris]|uniref:uncharacterized protein n=1 Tax=Nicotiana sylvestris TaxID=4096 RepID=UPI00388CE015